MDTNLAAKEKTIPGAIKFERGSLRIVRKLKSSETSSIFEVELNGNCYAMKFHDNGDPGFTRKGRDLNRFRCELNAYRNLHRHGVCDPDGGAAPRYYGYIDRLVPAMFQPHLDHFANDLYHPMAILLEYLRDAEELNCVNYTDDRFEAANLGLILIQGALVHHGDIDPKNILIVHGHQERVVWIGFDVSSTFLEEESMNDEVEGRCQDEFDLLKNIGELLRENQRQGLPPNTKYY